jgi:hypothetical protein
MLIHGGIRVTFLTLIVGAPPRPPPPPTAGCRAAEPATPTRMDASAMGGRLRFQHGGQAPPPHRAGRHVRRGRGRKRGARGGRGGRGTPEISSRDRSKPFVQPIKTRESGAPAVQGVLYHGTNGCMWTRHMQPSPRPCSHYRGPPRQPLL